MKIYYVADSKRKKRILRKFKKKETALAYCNELNQKHKGRFICGDWVTHSEYGRNKPFEWEWDSQFFDEK